MSDMLKINNGCHARRPVGKFTEDKDHNEARQAENTLSCNKYGLRGPCAGSGVRDAQLSRWRSILSEIDDVACQQTKEKAPADR
jgi:hypothetical protein